MPEVQYFLISGTCINQGEALVTRSTGMWCCFLSINIYTRRGRNRNKVKLQHVLYFWICLHVKWTFFFYLTHSEFLFSASCLRHSNCCYSVTYLIAEWGHRSDSFRGCHKYSNIASQLIPHVWKVKIASFGAEISVVVAQQGWADVTGGQERKTSVCLIAQLYWLTAEYNWLGALSTARWRVEDRTCERAS